MNAKTIAIINIVLGVWLVISPFLLGYSVTTSALWNSIVVGVLVVVVSLVGASQKA